MNPMEDLDDCMLIRILIRLPNCATVLACTLVNKRWCSLIFDPNFPVQFTNHKKKATTLLNSQDDKPPWNFAASTSLEFLPSNTFTFRATAAFKDLVLCTSHETVQGGGRLYYITNPLTKQWVALPPCPYRWSAWTALIFQPPYHYTRDYKFRVVEVCGFGRMDHHCPGIFQLAVYCSEIDEWKKIKLRVPKEAGPIRLRNGNPENVVCNGIIYLKIGLCLVAFDPFDVNDTCDTTLEATLMPPLPDFGHLKESSGQLLVVHTPKRGEFPCLRYKKYGTAIELYMLVWKLDPNQAPLVWETTFHDLCKGTGNKTESPHNSESEYNIYPFNIRVHPYNEKLIYMYLSHEKQLVSCNTRTVCIKLLQSSSNSNVLKFHRVERQWWPTLVPACAMPHSTTKLATTTAS